MFSVLTNSWALLLGMLLLMLGNGLHGTLLGVRGQIEAFSTIEMSIIMSAYFAGFLVASRFVPELIRRVGHVRVFAALGSLVSAVLILFPLLTDPFVWIAGRAVIGFCFCGVYVTAESWLNNAASNENRGKALSLYMIVQMAGIVAGQGLLLLADPGGYVLFIVISILVSVSFAPILLSISPTPAFERTNPMSLGKLIKSSPLGCVGMFLLGGVFSVQFGMGAVFGAEAGLSLPQISIFVAAFYVGAMVFQYPIGWFSDRMDRRTLIAFVSAACAFSACGAIVLWSNFGFLVGAAFIIGGMANPLYSLLIAHTNDFLEFDDMVAASGGLLFLNGVGAISGPIVVGWMLSAVGPSGFFIVIMVLMAVLFAYSIYRMTQRPTISVTETGSFTAVAPNASPIAVEIAQEYAKELAIDEENSDPLDRGVM